MSITYYKLKSGNWGVKSTNKIAAGQAITVTKRDNTTKSEIVEKVVWTDNSTVWLGAVRSSTPAGSSRNGSSGARRTGCSCGSREDSNGILIPSARNCRQCEYDAE